MVSPTKMRNDKLNTEQFFYLSILRLYVFHRFGQYLYAISRAQVVIRSGSWISNKQV